MNDRMVIAVSVALFLAAGVSTDASALCLKPPAGLRTGQPNVDNETLVFNYRGASFPIDVYSGYAPQSSTRSGVFCIRYEIENNASKPVDLLYWPLASGLQIESLQSKGRQSIAVTAPASATPIVGNTLIYAFLSEVVKTFAYQQNKQYSRTDPSPFDGRLGNFDNAVPAKAASTSMAISYRLAQIEENQSYDLKEPRKYPEIGSQFSTQDLDVSASSSAEWNGKYFTIEIKVGRNSSKAKDLQAPFTNALAKGGSNSEIVSNYMSFKKAKAVLPLSDNTFGVSFQSGPSNLGLYVIQQPITFFWPRRAHMFLSCRLFTNSYPARPLIMQYQQLLKMK